MKNIIKLLVTLNILCSVCYAQSDIVYFGNYNTSINVIERNTDNKGIVNWTEGTIRVIGVGYPPLQALPNQRILFAENSAILSAYKTLYEVINDIKVDAESTVRDYINTSETIKLQINTFIRGAQRVNRRVLEDGTVEVEMELNLYGPGGLIDIIQPQKPRVPSPPSNIKPENINKIYTGVIIDLRHLKDAAPCFKPSILDKQGGEIYLNNLAVDNEFIIKYGVVGYTTSITEARKMSRVGDSPLELKGLKLSGSFNTDVILEDTDIGTLLALNKETRVLNNARVIFVLPEKN